MRSKLMLRDGAHLFRRSATNADGDEARSLIFEVLAEYGLKGEADVTDACVKDIEANYFGRGGCFHIIEDETGAMLGCYGLYPHGPATCELRKMYVRRAARGRGLGKQLMVLAIEQAKALGFRRIELDTAGSLREAIGLYESFGFTPFHNPHMPARCDRAFALDL